MGQVCGNHRRPTRSGIEKATRALAATALWVIICTIGSRAIADPYRLTEGDKVDIAVFQRQDLSTSARVDVEGNVRLPLVGAVRASGLTISQLEKTLADAYRDHAGILDPRVNLAISETGPIFLVGAVKNPGRYSWEPGLTALKAYAQAGGAPRLSDGSTAFLGFEAYRAIEQEQQATIRLASLLLRRARLTAEASLQSSFTPPGDWSAGLPSEKATELADQEMKLFKSRWAALEGELALFERQREILAEQDQAYREALAKKMQQAALLQQELSTLDTPEGQRVVPVPRLLSLRRSIVEVEADERDIFRRIAETRLQVASAEQTVLNLKNARTIEASTQLAELEVELITLNGGLVLARRRAALARQIVEPNPSQPRSSMSNGDSDDSISPAFEIQREVNGEPRTVRAEDGTKLEPRDLLIVR